jgi:hypothetical protein
LLTIPKCEKGRALGSDRPGRWASSFFFFAKF